MIIKDISFKTPQQNIDYDIVLLYLAENGKGGEVLRFWESPSPFVVLGRISNEDDDVKKKETAEHNIPIIRRASGGGTVLQGKGCLNYTLILSKEKEEIASLRKSYQWILERMVSAFKNLDIDAQYWPISDIALANGQKKISGNAQKRGKHYILHHGTILYNFDLDMIERFLKHPKDIPEYRRNRMHLDFLANIHRPRADICREVSRVFNGQDMIKHLTDVEREFLGEFSECTTQLSHV